MLLWIIGIIAGIAISYRITTMLFVVVVAVALAVFCVSPYSFLKRLAFSPLIWRNCIFKRREYSQKSESKRSMLLITNGNYLYFLLIYSGYPKAFWKI